MTAQRPLPRPRAGGLANVEVDPVRTAVVGLGYWGPNLARNIHELPTAELTLICDRREEALQPLAQRYPSVRTTLDFDRVLDDEAIEAVVIATPVSSHAELAAAALEAGKHVFVEKPLTTSLEDAQALAALADDHGLLLMPGHTFVYSPSVNLVRDLIRAGELGDIYFISASRVNLGIHQPDVSVVWDLAPHDFSILRYWLDELPTHISALSRSCVWPNVPDVAFIDLEYPSGILAHVELSWLAPSKLRRTTIVGADRMIVYDDTSNEPVRIFDSGVMIPDPQTFGEFQLSYRSGDIVSPHVAAAEPLALELDDFCRSIRTSDVPKSSIELGMDVIRMIAGAEHSLAEGGGRIELQQFA